MSPIFDYLCPNCKRKVVDLFVWKYDAKVVCKRCGDAMKKLVPSSSKFIGTNCFPSEGIYLEHVEPGGRTFYSKQEMVDYEKNTGTIIGRLH